MATVTGDTGFTVSCTLSASVPVTLICPPGRIEPYAPKILSISQATQTNLNGTSSVLVCGVAQSPVTGALPITSFKLYRSNLPTGPFSLLCSLTPISATAIVTQCFDANPIFGVEEFYIATAIDSDGNESGPSNVVSYAASATSAGLVAGNFSAAARGPYPLLGCDVFIDPTTGEAVVGPNGDLLTVNGLECLAQDLRLRVLTEIGELAMHPNYGFDRSKVIGSGQAKPQVQAQIFRADIIDMLNAEPRVYKVLSVSIGQQITSQNYGDAWIISYTIMAINVEDPQQLNLVYNFYGAAKYVP